MSRRTPYAVICGIALLVVSIITASSWGAEFRTSVRGHSLLRPVTYQEPIEEFAVEGVPGMESLEVGTGDCTTPGWDDQCGTGCGSICGPGWSYWGSFEFLLWWRGGQDLPPLVTTSPSTVAATDAGVLGLPDTQVLYATESQGGDARPGGRLTFGAWFDACQFSGAGARLYALGESTAHYDIDSDINPVLARPFYNVTLAQQDADVVAFPTFTTGAIAVRDTSRVSGGDVFYRRLFYQDGRRRVDLIAGYQFATLDTDLTIFSTRTSVRQEGSIPFGTVIQNSDDFDCQNRYHAGEIGFWGDMDRGNVTWSLLAKVGLGTMNQRTRIAGRTVTTVPGENPVFSDQGLLALGTNIGSYERNSFVVSPEIGLNLAYHMTDCIDLTFGYSFLYWNHVAMPGDQIDLSLNTTQIGGTLVGEPRPAFLGRDSSYHVHGLSFGVQWIW